MYIAVFEGNYITCKYIQLYVHLSPVPQPEVTINKSYSGTVYAGTELVLTVDICFQRVDVNISISIKWQNVYINIKQLVNDTRTTVSGVSGSEGNFKASLTYSPITISDSGRYWATVSIKPSDKFIHIKSLSTATNVVLNVHGD